MRSAALGVAVALVACNGDEGKNQNRTQPCNTNSAHGDACSGTSDVPQFQCVSGVCRASCTSIDSCTSVSGTWCNVSGGAGYCADSECAGFFQGGCAAPLRCAPVGNFANRCVGVGQTTEGNVCTSHGDCVAGTLCAGICFTPECDTGGAPGCTDANDTCIAAQADVTVGLCVDLCEPFGDPAECADATEWCFPDQREADGTLDGFCIPDVGDIAKGQPCGAGVGACDRGHRCLTFSGVSTCYELCDPEFATSGFGNTCDGTEACSGLTLNGAPVEWGACIATCEVFTDVGCNTPSQWCAPGNTRSGSPSRIRGTCAAPGTVAQDQPCNATNRCAAGMICVGSGGNTGTCEVVCDPQSNTSGVGACQTGTCTVLNITGGGQTIFGICQ